MFNQFLPEQASAFAYKVDWINSLITNISVFFLVLICGAMVYFAVRYRQTPERDKNTPQIKGSNALEIVWTAVPTIISIYIMYVGIVTYREMRHVPANALEINVTGQKWAWSFEYPNGKRVRQDFTVPVDTPIKLLLTSKDVLHSFFVPAMRVKSDAVPGMYTYVSFTPIKTGTYRVFCTEYCGKDHSAMWASVKVVSKAEYNRWVEASEDAGMSPLERGQKVYAEAGCIGCHTLNGTRLVGPSFLKLYGSEREFEDGSKLSLKDDEAFANYVRESILHANAKIVKGYQPNLMPAFEGQLTEDELSGLIAFIKAQDGAQDSGASDASAQKTETAEVDLSKMTPVERGEHLYKTKLCQTCHSIDGSRLVGPSFKGAYGRKAKLADGSGYEVTDDYIRNSIRNPMSQIVEGYPGAMPPFDQAQLSDDDVNDLIEYIKTLK